MSKIPYVPLPQPKKVESPQTKAAIRTANMAKRKMGMRGDFQAGELINKSKSMSKEKLAILGLI